MIGTRGFEIDCGEFISRAAWYWRPSKARFRAALAGPHLVGDAERLLEHLEAVAERREGEAETPRFVLVPRCPDPEPGPSARQDVERRRRLYPEPGSR